MIPIRYNVRSLAVRKTTTIATALGIALVVFVLASALMLVAGIKKTLGASGRADTAIVLRKGSDNELSSTIEDVSVGLVLAAPGVKKDERGAPIGGGEVVVVLALDKTGTEGISNVQFRGVREDVAKLRPDFRIVEGRPARPGTDEVVLGRHIRGRFRGLDLNALFDLRKNRPVKVVGIFADGGSSCESEVWADVDVIKSSFGRDAVVSSVRALLDTPTKFEAFKASVEQDKQLGFMAMRETEYYEKQSEGTSSFVRALGSLIAFFFSIGAMIGAMITMYAAVANRQREIGTLRALGFSRTSILTSFLLESFILALIGGAVGTIAAMGMGFIRFSMMNFASWSEMVFTFDPTPSIIVTSLVFAGVMGILGGLFPAVRAARVSPVPAMRG